MWKVGWKQLTFQNEAIYLFEKREIPISLRPFNKESNLSRRPIFLQPDWLNVEGEVKICCIFISNFLGKRFFNFFKSFKTLKSLKTEY